MVRTSAWVVTVCLAGMLGGCGSSSTNDGPGTGAAASSGSGTGSAQASESIGPSGGTVELEDGLILDVPADALPEDTMIEVSALPDADAPASLGDVTLLSKVYDFQPDGLVFETPIEVTIPYEGGDTVILAFSESADGTVEDLEVLSADGEVAVLSVPHFTKGMAAQCTTDKQMCFSHMGQQGERRAICGNPVEWEEIRLCGEGEGCIAGHCTCKQPCGNKTCGEDACGNSCGTCAAQETCEAGECVAASCTPECSQRECGDDGCGDTCGSCAGGEECNQDTGQCESTVQTPTCDPACPTGATCTADNTCTCDTDGETLCGREGTAAGTCCASGLVCEAGVCTEVPSCQQGVPCGQQCCPQGYQCIELQCIPAQL